MQNLQVATLIITSDKPADANQPLLISNIAYTISLNFDTALSVSVPIYAWGNYEIRSKSYTTKINVATDQKVILVKLSNLFLVQNGVNLANMQIKNYTGSGSISAARIIDEPGLMVLNVSGAASAGSHFCHAVDVTHYNQLIMEEITLIKTSVNNNSIRGGIGVFDDANQYVYPDFYCTGAYASTQTLPAMIIDITTLTGVKYVYAGIYCNNFFDFNGILKFKNMYLTT